MFARGLAIACTIGCASDREVPVEPEHGLAALVDGELRVSPGAGAIVSIDRACVPLDDSFGGSYGGVELTIVQYGGSSSRSCSSAYGRLDSDAPLASSTVELHDRYAWVISTFPDGALTPRTMSLRSHAEWRFAAGETVRLSYSRAADLAGAEVTVAWFPDPTVPSVPLFKNDTTAVASGDEIAFALPAAWPTGDGKLRVIVYGQTTAALECLGIRACELWPGAALEQPITLMP